MQTKKTRKTTTSLRTQWEKDQATKTEVPPPGALALNDIKRTPEVFQHRTINVGWGNTTIAKTNKLAQPLVDQNHVNELLKSLKAKQGDGDAFTDNQMREREAGQPVNLDLLDPVTVFRIGKDWHLLDGFHRCEAYRKWNMHVIVPVKAFQGTFDEALLHALAANSQDKLPMSRSEKTEAVWKMVLAEVKGDRRKIANAAGISERTVGAMRALYNKHREAIIGDMERFGGISWDRARTTYSGNLPDEMPSDDDDEDAEDIQWATQAARRFGHVFKDSLATVDARRLLLAVRIYSEPLHDRLVKHVTRDETEEDDEEEAA